MNWCRKNKNLLIITILYMTFVCILKATSHSGTLIAIGLIEIAVGGFASGGGLSVGKEYDLKYDQKIPQMNYSKTPERLSEEDKSLSFMLVIASLGIVTLVIGII